MCIGDRVSYKNSSGTGRITRFTLDGKVMVYDNEYEMEIPYPPSELIAISCSGAIEQVVSVCSSRSVKADAPKSKFTEKGHVGGNSRIVEIDLHFDRHMKECYSVDESYIYTQLECCRRALSNHKAHKGIKIIFIHGKGNGKLRQQIINLVRKSYPSYTISDAPFSKYGMYGASEVVVR